MATSDSSIHEVDHRIDYAFWVIFMPVVLVTVAMNTAWIVLGPQGFKDENVFTWAAYLSVIACAIPISFLGAKVYLTSRGWSPVGYVYRSTLTDRALESFIACSVATTIFVVFTS